MADEVAKQAAEAKKHTHEKRTDEAAKEVAGAKKQNEKWTKRMMDLGKK